MAEAAIQFEGTALLRDGGPVGVSDRKSRDAGVNRGIEGPAGLRVPRGKNSVPEAKPAGPLDAVAKRLVLKRKARQFRRGRSDLLRGLAEARGRTKPGGDKNGYQGTHSDD